VIWHNGAPAFMNRRSGPAGTWGTPIQVSGAESTGTAIGADVATNSAGTVFGFWPTTGNSRIFSVKSINGGTSYSSPQQVAMTFDSYDIGVPSFRHSTGTAWWELRRQQAKSQQYAADAVTLAHGASKGEGPAIPSTLTRCAEGTQRTSIMTSRLTHLARLAAIALLLTGAGGSGETWQQAAKNLRPQLAALDPSALDVWDRAAAAVEGGDHERAADLFAELYRRVPKYIQALRLQAEQELLAGRFDLARRHAGEAVSLERSSDNLATLAMAVLVGVQPNQPTAQEIADAKDIASAAVNKRYSNPLAHSVLAQVAVALQDRETAQREAEIVRTQNPESLTTCMLTMWIAGTYGDWDKATAALERARQLGLPQRDYEVAKDQLEAAMSAATRRR
jgi:tetratricopeptide (TPR) repeat protein